MVIIITVINFKIIISFLPKVVDLYMLYLSNTKK